MKKFYYSKQFPSSNEVNKWITDYLNSPHDLESIKQKYNKVINGIHNFTVEQIEFFMSNPEIRGGIDEIYRDLITDKYKKLYESNLTGKELYDIGFTIYLADRCVEDWILAYELSLDRQLN